MSAKQIVIIFSLLLGTYADAWAQTRVAFVAGVERYNKSGLKDLEYAEDDAREVKYALEDLGFTTTSVIGQDASLYKLNKSLDEFIAATKRLNKSDIAIVYFFFRFPDPFFGGPFPFRRSISNFSLRRSS